MNNFIVNKFNNIYTIVDDFDDERDDVMNGYKFDLKNTENANININNIINLSDELLSIASNLTTLDSQQKHIFNNVLKKVETIFSNKPGCANSYKHHIRIKKDKPIVKKNYPIPYAMREATDKAIKEMLNLGIIERSISNYCNPLRVILKKDKTARCCLDARFINEYIHDDLEPPPLICEVIQKYHGATFF